MEVESLLLKQVPGACISRNMLTILVPLGRKFPFLEFILMWQLLNSNSAVIPWEMIKNHSRSDVGSAFLATLHEKRNIYVFYQEYRKKWKPLPELQNTRNKNDPSDNLFQSPYLISDEQSCRDIRGQTKITKLIEKGIME